MTRRIFDAFPFDGELDLLEFHLRETFDHVDFFVLIEAGQTYRGDPKPCHFDANQPRFAWARHKIRPVRLARLGSETATARERAAVQRQAMTLALGDAAPDDIILLLDVDEVPSVSALQHLRVHGLAAPQRLEMTRHYGFADRLGPASPCCPADDLPFASAHKHQAPGAWATLDPRWFGHSGVAIPFSALANRSAFDLRYATPMGEPMRDAGRHYSSVDPTTRLEDKLGRVFHAEWDGPRERDPRHLARCRRFGVHHRGWWYADRPAGDLPDDVARLVAVLPSAEGGACPHSVMRRLVRAWAWMRLSPLLPARLVRLI
ncbi:MAG: hypothetical protein RL367_1668, partial [Pseudomonadota bacterium]